MTDFRLLLTALCLYLTFPEFEYVCALNYRWPALFRAIFIVLMRASPYVSWIMTRVQLCKIKSLRPAFSRGTSLLIDNPPLLIRKKHGWQWWVILTTRDPSHLYFKDSSLLHAHTCTHTRMQRWDKMKYLLDGPTVMEWGRMWWKGEEKNNEWEWDDEHMMMTHDGWNIWIRQTKNGPLLSSIQNEQAQINWIWMERSEAV